MENFYRIEELCTSGWELIDDDYVRLTKEQASAKLKELIGGGFNPNRLRAVPDV